MGMVETVAETSWRSGFKLSTKIVSRVIKPGGRVMNMTTDHPREPIVIGQQVISTRIADVGNAQVCLGVIAPEADRIERDRPELCEPFDASTLVESDQCSETEFTTSGQLSGQ